MKHRTKFTLCIFKIGNFVRDNQNPAGNTCCISKRFCAISGEFLFILFKIGNFVRDKQKTEGNTFCISKGFCAVSGEIDILKHCHLVVALIYKIHYLHRQEYQHHHNNG